jgi:hypothetical protein
MEFNASARSWNDYLNISINKLPSEKHATRSGKRSMTGNGRFLSEELSANVIKIHKNSSK